jgi:hypothetical protein
MFTLQNDLRTQTLFSLFSLFEMRAARHMNMNMFCGPITSDIPCGPKLDTAVNTFIVAHSSVCHWPVVAKAKRFRLTSWTF